MKAAHRAIPRRAALRSQAAHLAAADAGLSARAAPRGGRGSLSTLAAAAPAQGAEAALKHTPFGERGTGFYTDATRGCFDVLARLEAPVLAAVEAALCRRAAAGDFASPFRIADYGTADGGTSMPLVRKCALKVRAARGFEATPVEVLYEDQPGNDWVSVFNRTQGLVATPNVPDAARGLGDFENLVVLASGRSFYHPCFSPGSVDVAFCATAFHWLTAMPCVIPDALHSAASQDPVAVKAYMVQADVDWRQILAARSRELKPGCRLVVANFAKDAEGQFLGNTHRTQSMHHCFAEIWRGLVTPEEFAATNFPNQYRTLEECTAPFGAEGSGTFAGLKILEAETGVVSCPYLDGYLADPTRRTPTEQALYFHNTTRTWSNSTFVAGLGAGRSHEERTALVDALFAGYVQRIAASPGQHGMDYVHSYLTLERQEGAAVGGGGGGGGGGALKMSRPARAPSAGCSDWRAPLPDSTAAAQMLPKERGCAGVLMRSFPDFDIYVGSALGTERPMSIKRPGNGGMRIWAYESSEKAQEAAIALAQGMEVKHAVYNTGFAGAKVVVNVASDAVIREKERILAASASFLHDLQGTMYTGCDINSTEDDMDHLARQCPYVLAGIGNRALNPNDATAYGVIGALEAATAARYGGIKNTTFVVHGCGNVGGTVARELVAAGARVYVCDKDSGRAEAVAGATNVSEAVLAAGAEGWGAALPPHDVLVPCSMSQIITTAVARDLPATAIVGATNVPFQTAEAQAAFAARGTLFIPECITSAGAILADSIEHFARESFVAADASLVYRFCRDTVSSKSVEAMAIASAADKQVAQVIPDLITSAAAGNIVGHGFQLWLDRRSASTARPRKVRVPKLAPAPRGRPLSVPKTPGFARMFSSVPSQQADVCIVGAGIMGMNAAYQLKRRDPSLRVVVLERAPALGYGSSGYSTGFLRAFYSFDNTMALALDGIHAYRNWGDYTQLGDEAEAFFTETGALWMLGKPRAGNQALVDRLNAFNVGCDMMGADDIQRRFPALSTEPFPEIDAESGELVEKDWGELTAVFEHGCGHMDSSACLRDIFAACAREGVEVRFNSRVREFTTGSGGKVDGVALVGGSAVSAGAVLNCAGPWFQQLNGPAGVTTSTEMLPTRIQVGHKALPDDEDLLGLPFVADFWGASGIYFMPRRQNRQLVFGSIAHRFESEVVDPDSYNEALDPDVKQDYLQCLFHRLPTLPTRGDIQGFSHMYTVNQDDVHPVIGASKEYSNLFLCNGFSGHGFKLAPAVGSLLSQQILGSKTAKWETSIPLDFMSPHRAPLKLEQKTHFA